MFGKYDITFCVNKNCRKRGRCERSTDRLVGDKHAPKYVSMAGFVPEKNGRCEHFVQMEQPGAKKE